MKNKALYTSNHNEWATPPEIFEPLNAEFNFTLDPCSSDQNYKCEKHYTKDDDGLSKSWKGETVFCNPPYGRDIKHWARKCYEESKHATIVMLIPARTDTKYFHDYIYGKAELRFLKGRIKFIDIDGKQKQGATFPSMIVIYRRLI